MSKKFLTNVELEAGLVDGSNSAGTSGYVLSSTGTATSWIDPATIAVAESEQVHIACKNTSGVAISKGDPVYITGTVGTSFIVQIAKADASNSAKMPAVGLAETDLAINAEGYVIVSGVLKNITTDPLSTGDGTPSSNDTVYVKAGGGLTRTKPTGASNLIQNVGKVGRVQGTSAGSLAVSTIMRTNDVPNLNTGKIWVGSSTYTTESGVVHLDESNSRMGINTATPAFALDVDSGTVGAASIFLEQVSPSVNFYDLTFLGSIFMSSGQMGFQTNSSTRMVISSSGNVGIGTTSPGAKTHIYGPNHTGAFNTGALMIQQSSDNSRMFIDGNDIDAADGILFLNDYSLNAVRLGGDLQIPNGDIGIGFTTAPTQRLHVDGNVRVTGAYYDSNNSAGTSGQVLSSTATGTDWVSLSEISGVDGTGTANYIAKWSDADTITNSIIYDNGSNVGIGTSPSYKLHVSGSTNEIAGFTSSATTTALRIENTHTNGWGSNLQFWTLGTAAGFFGTIGSLLGSTDQDLATYATTGNGIRFYTNGNNERMRIDSSGNVGIGTSSPSYLLQAQKNQAAYTYIASDNANAAASGTGSGFAMTESGSIAWYLRSERDGTGKFNIGNSENRLTIDSSGRVGIGTSSPGYKLDVKSSGVATYVAHFTSSDGASLGGMYEDASTNGEFYVKNSTGSTNVLLNSSGTSYLNGGNVGIGTTSPSAKLQVRTSGYDTGTTGFRLTHAEETNYVGFMRLQTPAGDPIFSLGTIDGASTYDTLFMKSGNVGIGTSSPSYKLDVSGSANINGIIIGSNGDSINKAGNLFIQTTTASDLILRTNSTERLRIDSSGNVGIGTSSPSSILHIQSSSATGALLNLETTHSGGIPIYNMKGAHSAQLRYQDENGNNQSRIDFNDGGDFNFVKATDGTSHLKITSAGNVGIGTSSPAAKLQVGDGTTDVSARVYYSDGAYTEMRGFGLEFNRNSSYIRPTANNSKTLLVGWSNARWSTLSFDASTTTFNTNGSENMRITSTGKVGIGTTSPAERLEVAGNVILDASNANLKIKAGTTGTKGDIQWTFNTDSTVYASAGITYDNRATDGFLIDSGYPITLDYASSYIRFSNNGSEKMRINTSGNVGIGTTSPSHELTVKGGGANTTVEIESSAEGNTFLQFNNDGGGSTGNGGGDSYINFGAYNISPLADDTDRGQIRYSHSSNFMTFTTEGSERMRINNNGYVGINATNPQYPLDVNGDVRINQGYQLIITRNSNSSASSSSCIYVDNAFSSGGNPYNIDSDLSSFFGSRHIGFRYNGTIVGYIGASGTTAVTYSTTSSDERLKKNIEDWQENILDKFEQIEPKKFNFITEADGTDKTKGFIAQNMVADFPEAYPHDYSEDQYHSFNPSGMVIYLMKAVKELAEKNKQLEARIQVLENQ